MLVGVQFHVHSLLPEFLTGVDIFQVRYVILENNIAFEGQAQCFSQRLLSQVACALVEIGRRDFDPAAGIGEAVVIENESAFVVVDVGVGEYVLVHAPIGSIQIVKEELLNVCKQMTAMKDREDLPVVSGDETFVGRLIPFRFAELHPIFFREPFHLSVAVHW
jgi:hypothetical protein